MDAERLLVQRCLAGDREAIGDFVERFRGLIFGICWRMLQHREDAEDVTQESFARIFRHLSQWQPTRPLRPWLIAIAANRCRTRLTQRKTWLQTGVEFAEAETPSIGRELGEELERGISQLREDHRQCFVMFYQDELNIQEIAAALNCPEGTVKTWLFRARKQLGEYLLQRGVVDREGYELHHF